MNRKKERREGAASNGNPPEDSFVTVSSAPIESLYDETDVAELDYQRDLGDPGEYPYTRGIYPTTYRGRLWTMRQFAGFGSARETNCLLYTSPSPRDGLLSRMP